MDLTQQLRVQDLSGLSPNRLKARVGVRDSNQVDIFYIYTTLMFLECMHVCHCKNMAVVFDP